MYTLLTETEVQFQQQTDIICTLTTLQNTKNYAPFTTKTVHPTSKEDFANSTSD